jgi:hypothetical protein
MILTEHGLTFERDGDSRSCVQHPELRAYADGTYGLDGRPERYSRLSDALAARTAAATPDDPVPARRR